MAPLEDGQAPFAVDVRLFLYAAMDGVSGTLVVQGEWGDEQRLDVTLAAGENNVTVTLTAAAPQLWWASGMGGAQPMYNVTAFFAPGASAALGAKVQGPRAVRRVGFRHVTLTTFDDTNASWVAHAEATHL